MKKQETAFNKVFDKELDYLQLHLIGFNPRHIKNFVNQTLKVLVTPLYKGSPHRNTFTHAFIPEIFYNE